MDARPLTIHQAADRLGMTSQGVRKAVREGRLKGTVRLQPGGRREYEVPEAAIDDFVAGRGSPEDNKLDTVTLRLEMAMAALHAKELEFVELRTEFRGVKRQLDRTRKALAAFTSDDVSEDETRGGPISGSA